jgi:dTDP-4-dehydrorhamnose 3,5-epimerase
MKIYPASIPDILIMEPRVFGDSRGFFLETYREDILSEAGISCKFVQDNHSGSIGNVLRGLHYQIRRPQGKLVHVGKGKIFDVAVDLRHTSSTFGQWMGLELSDQNRLQLWIPAGFAHGFYVLSEWAELIYKTTDYYAPEWERTILWNDPDLGVEWPINSHNLPILSLKDSMGIRFKDAEIYT